jgi:hypothetical protein
MTLHRSGFRFAVALGLVAAGLAYSTPGASAPGPRMRADELKVVFLTIGRPKAGKAFGKSAQIIDVDTGYPVQSGSLRCPARIGQRTLTVGDKSYLRDLGIYGCSWLIPRNAGGKRLIGGIQLTSHLGTARGDFSKVIRR